MDASIYCFLPLLLLLATAEAVGLCEDGKPMNNLTITTFGTKDYISSPEYPANYVTTKHCSISLQVSTNTPHAVHIEQPVDECYVSYDIVGETTEQIVYRYVNCTKVDVENIYSYANDILYNYTEANGFKVLLRAGAGSGFNFSIAAYPLLSMEPTNSTVDLTTTPTVFITSHRQFPKSFYSNNLHNKLTLTNIPSGYQAVIEFVYIQLGHSENCQTGNSAKDILKVNNSLSSLLYECGDITNLQSSLLPLPSLVISASDPMSPIVLEFTTNAEGQFPGFLLRFTVVEYKPSESAPEATSATQTTTTMQADNTNSSQRVTTGDPETQHTRMKQTKATRSPQAKTTKESQTENTSRANATANDTVSESTASSPSSTTTNRSQLYAIAGGAGGGLLLLLIVIAVLACVVYTRSKNRKESSLRATPHCVNSADAVDNSEFEWRAEGGTNMHLENPYFELEPPEHVEMQPQTDQNTSHAPPGGASSRTRSEPTGMDINAVYTPVVKKDKLEMVENSLYGSA